MQPELNMLLLLLQQWDCIATSWALCSAFFARFVCNNIGMYIYVHVYTQLGTRDN
jgi:hypothetical protein